MDSQEQYEALLKDWGFEDRSAIRRARREKRAQNVKTTTSFFKKMFSFSGSDTSSTQSSLENNKTQASLLMAASIS